MSKMQQSIPGSVRQKEDLIGSNVAPCPSEKKEASVLATVTDK